MTDIVKMMKDGNQIYPQTDVKAIQRLESYLSNNIDLGGGLVIQIKNFLANYSINFYGVVSSIPSGRTVKTGVIPSDYRPQQTLMVRATMLSGDTVQNSYDLVLLLLTNGDIHLISNGVSSPIEVGFNIGWIG